jgi:hypothetical protein
MHKPLELSSVTGATSTGVAQRAASPKTDENAVFIAKGKITPKSEPVAKAMRKAKGTSRSLLNSGGRSRAASRALIGRKKFVPGR